MSVKQDIFRYDPFLIGYYKSNYKVFRIIDRTITLEDFLQIGRVLVLEGLQNYDPKRAKESTFIIGHLNKKLSSIKKTIRAKRQESPLNDLLLNRELFSDDDVLSFYHLKSKNKQTTEDKVDTLIIYGKLDELNKKIFIKYFINQLAYKTIGKQLGISAHTVSDRVAFLRKIFKTLLS